MATKPQLLYWDSSVILSYFNAHPDRLPILEAILDDISKSGRSKKIVTSTIAKVEVAFVEVERLRNRLRPGVEQSINDFWSDNSVIELVEVHAEIADIARTMIRGGIPRGWRLKTADAIHLATAKWVGAIELQTYDLPHFQRYAPEIGMEIREPRTLQPRLVDTEHSSDT